MKKLKIINKTLDLYLRKICNWRVSSHLLSRMFNKPDLISIKGKGNPKNTSVKNTIAIHFVVGLALTLQPYAALAADLSSGSTPPPASSSCDTTGFLSCDQQHKFQLSTCADPIFLAAKKCNIAKCAVSQSTLCGSPDNRGTITNRGITFSSYAQCLRGFYGNEDATCTGLSEADKIVCEAATPYENSETGFGPEGKMSGTAFLASMRTNLGLLANVSDAHCSSLQLGLEAYNQSRNAAIISGSAATVCLAGCATLGLGILTAGISVAAANAACAAADAASIIHDIAAIDSQNRAFSVTYHQYATETFPFLENLITVAEIGGPVVVGVGAAFVGTGDVIAQRAASAASREAAKKAAAEYTKKITEKSAKLLGKNITVKAGQKASSAALFPCIAGAMLTASTGMHANAAVRGKTTNATNAAGIIALDATGDAQVGDGGNSGPAGQNDGVLGVNSNRQGQSATFGAAVAQGNGDDEVQGNIDVGAGGIASQATADVARLVNRDKVREILDELGTSEKGIGRLLDKMSPGAMVASLVPDLPQDFKDALLKQDEDIKSGRLVLSGGFGLDNQAPVYSSGGAATASSETRPRFKPRSVHQTPNLKKEIEITQEKKKILGLMNDGDIFHEKWNGSIFQIVSLKLKSNQDKFESTEWVTPLNRALNGLPRLPTRLPAKGARMKK